MFVHAKNDCLFGLECAEYKKSKSEHFIINVAFFVLNVYI